MKYGIDENYSKLFVIDCCEKEQIEEEQQHEKLASLNTVLATLSSKQKEIIHLRFYNGASYREISNTLLIKEDSVKKQVYRILKKIRA